MTMPQEIATLAASCPAHWRTSVEDLGLEGKPVEILKCCFVRKEALDLLSSGDSAARAYNGTATMPVKYSGGLHGRHAGMP